MLRIVLFSAILSLCATASAQAILLNQAQPPGGDLPAASFKRAVLSFALMGQVTADDNEFQALTVENVGSPAVGSSDIVTVQLWLDDGDNHFQDGTDLLLASKATGVFPCVLMDFSETQTVTEIQTKRYFISVDVASDAMADKFLKLKIEASGIGLQTGTATLQGVAVAGESFKTVANSVPVLVIVTQPTAARVGQPLTSQPVIELHDAAGNKLNDSITEVTVSVTAGSGEGGIGPANQLTVKASSGVVTFSDLSIDKAGDQYQLTFVAANFGSATSDKLAIAGNSPPVM
ncbi:MAG: hypothetical protein L3J82_08020, partial [Planctomycetes bacterium]|nr:hypothetical protein [Planctomycetota bacterium]